MSPEELTDAQSCIRDSNLKNFLEFGIGMHHAGLKPEDKDIVEELYCAQKIQVTICTSLTLTLGLTLTQTLTLILYLTLNVTLNPSKKDYLTLALVQVVICTSTLA